MSVAFDHMLRYYKELDSLAKDEVLDGVELRMFRGKVVNVFRSLEIPQSYYSKVRSSLITMGCITILKQGARGSGSVVVLHHPPEREDFTKRHDAEVLTPRLDVAILAQQLEDVKRLVGGVNIPEAIYELSQELGRLKREVQKLGKTAPQPQRRV